MNPMQETYKVQKGNMLQVTLSLAKNQQGSVPFFTQTHSPRYMVNEHTVFQIRVDCYSSMPPNQSYYNSVAVKQKSLVYVKFCKLKHNFTHSLKFTSKALNITGKTYSTCDDSTWYLAFEGDQTLSSFDVTVSVDIVPSGGSFAVLHEDEVLADFELQGVDGSVLLHKTVLAASSPVMKTMFEGPWQENKEGRVTVVGTSKRTLQHLKDYIYLRKLPDVDLEQLLLLGSYYEIPDLEQRCVDKLVQGSNAQNVCDLFEFAFTHKSRRLLLAMLQCVKDGVLKIEDIRSHLDKLGFK